MKVINIRTLSKKINSCDYIEINC